MPLRRAASTTAAILAVRTGGNFVRIVPGALAALISLLLGACASSPSAGPSATTVASLACTLSSNCVDSLGTGGLPPFSYVGSTEQAMNRLLKTLAAFPEAEIVRREPLALEAIFTTRLGFRDQVDFVIDPATQRIQFRSRSLFGLFDWGKNRSRMEAVSARFAAQSAP
jgi:uncharacterized protein (DUF1499 family)